MGDSEPYLILHKVRGEPAFDIAIRLTDDIWIIPTSGHRAYPYWHEPLNRAVDFEMCRINGNKKPEAIPDDWPDHYEAKPAIVETRDLLKLLGLKRKAPNVIRRPV